MFKKLLQNLPFNPSLLGQVTFYIHRLRDEASIRRLSLVFIMLTMAVQLFAILVPPESSLAASTNDIVYGGISSSDPVAAMLKVYDADTDGRNANIRAIFTSFNISREDIAASQKGSINSLDHTLYSLGRNPHSVLDQPHDVDGKRYYLRPLHTWGDNKVYSALVGTRTTVQGTAEDRFFAIIIDCGNIVVKVRSQPKLTLTKTSTSHANRATVQPGETIRYRALFSNVGAGNAHDVTITDAIPQYTTYKWRGTGGANRHDVVNTPRAPFSGQPASKYVWWEYDRMVGQQENWYVDFDVTVDANAPDGAKICNTAFIRSIETQPLQSNPPICMTVKLKKTPPPVAPPPTTSPGQPIITKSKRASNLTQNVQDANETTVEPGDIISYQLLTINSGGAKYDGYVVAEEVNDILEYADVTEISDNGTLNDDGQITWKAADIKAETTLIRSFKIQVKDPLPATPRSASDPQSFDLRMDNVYGNEIRLHLQPPTIGKTSEEIVTTLPSTGPGSSLTVGFVVTVFITYFFARNRLMLKELETVKEDYATGGGF